MFQMPSKRSNPRRSKRSNPRRFKNKQSPRFRATKLFDVLPILSETGNISEEISKHIQYYETRLEQLQEFKTKLSDSLKKIKQIVLNNSQEPLQHDHDAHDSGAPLAIPQTPVNEVAIALTWCWIHCKLYWTNVEKPSVGLRRNDMVPHSCLSHRSLPSLGFSITPQSYEDFMTKLFEPLFGADGVIVYDQVRCYDRLELNDLIQQQELQHKIEHRMSSLLEHWADTAKVNHLEDLWSEVWFHSMEDNERLAKAWNHFEDQKVNTLFETLLSSAEKENKKDFSDALTTLSQKPEDQLIRLWNDSQTLHQLFVQYSKREWMVNNFLKEAEPFYVYGMLGYTIVRFALVAREDAAREDAARESKQIQTVYAYWREKLKENRDEHKIIYEFDATLARIFQQQLPKL